MKTKTRIWAVLAWLIVWQISSMVLRAAYQHGKLLLASPIEAFTRLLELGMTSAFWKTILVSTGHILLGFLLACFVAGLFAVLSARFPKFGEFLAPAVSTIKAVPVVSFIILALIWIGPSHLATFISALMVFPPVYLNILAGIRSADKELLEMAHVFDVPSKRVVSKIYIPAVFPYFRSAAEVGLGLCWKSGIAAEVIAVSTGTIGSQLYTSKIYFLTPDLFAWTAVIVTLSIVMEKIVLAAIDGVVQSKRQSQIGDAVAVTGDAAISASDVADAPKPLRDTKAATSDVLPRPQVSAHGISKSFGEKIVLQDVSFVTGEKVAILSSPSGTGKTTLLRILAGLEKADQGRVMCPGVSMEFQEHRLLEDCTGIENVEFVAKTDLERDKGLALIKELGLVEAAGQKVSTYSGGMKRRLALVRALLYPAEAVLLDEPFAGLDEENRELAWNVILRETAGRACIIATHEPPEGDEYRVIEL